MLSKILLTTAMAIAIVLPAAAAPAATNNNSAASDQRGEAAATDQRGETVEERIATLRAELKITPDEEMRWNSVAEAMRQNSANMEKLIAAKRQQASQGLTAEDDLKNYQEFAQAHLDGLKNLRVSFDALYKSMPDAQKKNADQVFQNFGH